MTEALRVLVVEDNPVNALLMTHVLRAWGYEAEFAADAAEAFELIERQRPGLVMLDLQLPDVDGFEVARRLKADPGTASIPIIALTGYAEAEIRQAAIDAGCDDFATKPIDVETLKAQVKRCLG